MKECSAYFSNHLDRVVKLSVKVERPRLAGSLGSSTARGGLWGYSPRRKVKSDFLEIFGIYSTLRTIFSPLIGRVSSHRKIPDATPASVLATASLSKLLEFEKMESGFCGTSFCKDV